MKFKFKCRCFSILCEKKLSMEKSQYLRWLWVADKWPEHQRMCETMARLVCRASRLKGAGFQIVVCTRYVLGIVEDIKHLLVQCPASEGDARFMLNEIEELNENFRIRSIKEPGSVLFWLPGKVMMEWMKMTKHLVETYMLVFIYLRLKAGHCIENMYKKEIREENG